MRALSKYFPTRLVVVLPVILATACQSLPGTVSSPNSRLQIAPSANQAPATSGDASANGANSTYTVKRDSLKQSLSMQGRVAPTRSAQLTLHGGGTVTAVSVQVGQAVKQGDALAEFAADDQSLQAARAQATLAELAYEQEVTKLKELQTGTPKDTVDQAQAVVARDKAAITQVNQQQQAAQDAATKAQGAATVAKANADRKVQLAQVSLQTAKDGLAAAQDAAQAADDATKSSQTQAQSDAAAAVASSKQAVIVADRAVKSVNIRLSQAKLNWATTKAAQDMESLQFRINQDNDALKDAKTAAQTAQTGTAAQSAAADAAVAAAKRAVAADQLELKHQQTNSASAKTVDDAAIEQATLDYQGAQDQLTQAQAAQQKAEQRVQTLAAQQTAPATSGQSTQLTPAAAQAGIKQAQHAVDTATINLQEAQAAADQAGPGTDTLAAPDPSTMDAAQAQLKADQAKLTSLQAGTSAAEVSREQARVNLLHDQVTAADAAAQPIMTLKAPFDGTVTDVGISAGQTVAPGAAGGLTTVNAALAGQNNQGEPVAIRLVASGTSSIVADASESDVSQLSAGQAVNVSFPGLAGQTVTASIGQIASAPTVKDGNVTYPVQVDLASAPANLRMGMSAQVSLSNSDGPTLIAPRAAVQSVAGQTSVTKVDPSGELENVPVQIGRSAGGNVELLGGVQEGDKILMPSTPATLPLIASQASSAAHP